MRQPDNLNFDRAHRAGPFSAAATRAIRVRATSSFDCEGQDSTPAAVTRCTVLRSPPITPVGGETSLATIQSQPLRFSFDLRVLDHLLGLSGKSDHELRPAAFQFRHGREDVGILL